jgi:hypothetical protein
MTAEQKAAFYDANPTFGAITRAGQKALDFIGIKSPLDSAIANGMKGLNAFNASNNVLGIAPAANPMSQDPAQRGKAEATTTQNQRTAQDTEQQSSDSPFGTDFSGADSSGTGFAGDVFASGGMVNSYAHGGAVRHYQAGGAAMSSMAEADQLIKALESGKLTENEREDAMSKVAEIYRRLDEEPVEAAQIPSGM